MVLQWERQRGSRIEKWRSPWQGNDVIIYILNEMYVEEEIKIREDNGIVTLYFILF